MKKLLLISLLCLALLTVSAAMGIIFSSLYEGKITESMAFSHFLKR